MSFKDNVQERVNQSLDCLVYNAQEVNNRLAPESKYLIVAVGSMAVTTGVIVGVPAAIAAVAVVSGTVGVIKAGVWGGIKLVDWAMTKGE